MGNISRRDLLRKGALLGGSVLWVAPVVQTVGIGQAFAQTERVSPGGERCLTVELIPTGPTGSVVTMPTALPGPQPHPGNLNNMYSYDIEVSNCGPLLITDIFVTLKVVSLAVNGGSAFDPAITWITNNNIGSLAPVNESTETKMERGFLPSYTYHTDQNIGSAFSAGATSGDTVEFKVRVTATESFGPVGDEQTYSAVIA